MQGWYGMQIYNKSFIFQYRNYICNLLAPGNCSRNCSVLVWLSRCFPSKETDNPCPKEQPRLNLFSVPSSLQLALLLQCQRGRCIIWEAFQMHLEQSKALWIIATKQDLSICHSTTGSTQYVLTAPHGGDTSIRQSQILKERINKSCRRCPSRTALSPVEWQQAHARHELLCSH